MRHLSRGPSMGIDSQSIACVRRPDGVERLDYRSEAQA